MAKVADVKLSWSKSPSANIKSVKVVVTKDGAATTTEVGPNVSEFAIVVEASKTVSFVVTVTDADGQTATSDVYTFTLDDLTSPLPATNLLHEIVAVRDV